MVKAFYLNISATFIKKSLFEYSLLPLKSVMVRSKAAELYAYNVTSTRQLCENYYFHV